MATVKIKDCEGGVIVELSSNETLYKSFRSTFKRARRHGENQWFVGGKNSKTAQTRVDKWIKLLSQSTSILKEKIDCENPLEQFESRFVKYSPGVNQFIVFTNNNPEILRLLQGLDTMQRYPSTCMISVSEADKLKQVLPLIEEISYSRKSKAPENL